MNLNELKKKLQEIKKRGFIESLRSGSTGIGYTLEKLLDLNENNLPIPDLGGRVEIKTIRKDSQSLITLFTFNRGAWQISQSEIIKTYGYKDEKERLALKNTLFYKKEIPQNIMIEFDEVNNLIQLVDKQTKKVLAIWDIYNIVGKFMSKLGRLLVIFADRKYQNDKEFFYYNEGYILSNPSSRKFIKAFKDSLIGIDLRMHLKENGSVRNRGTGFRIKEKDLIELYENIVAIL
ncbi:MAG TPA: MvaI/BcnI family restriction endonuclease [Caldisericia bacterium]|nr:MvaI/BcnI family restriction endonuclease [Caldisericia bacterium]HPB33269.1 MvaI/BcnI family restriction endonuclease [Caldisericia bacterium]HQL66415.1 MvaI/BcnI family restriction endonuclease [Caldisericia bacterium]HQN47886.1 MvaI/BcnI family restriction endonuclease [Caldisericia bacterium]HQO99284.1 MvaI/BcnI family restriction endonuclease [Caldisericia bacterium]